MRNKQGNENLFGDYIETMRKNQSASKDYNTAK